MHTKAREVFESLVYSQEEEDAFGRILLLLGEAGAGKTYLTRFFRTFLHSYDLGYFSYIQFSPAAIQRYDQYILQKVISSFDEPLLTPSQPGTALQRLSDGLARFLPAGRIQRVQEAETGEELGDLVSELADCLVDGQNLAHVGMDVLRALLYLQCNVPSIRIKVTRYLRGEELSSYDRNSLGGIAPNQENSDALQRIRDLVYIVKNVLGRVVVICFDELEVIGHHEDLSVRMIHIFDFIKHLAEIPGLVTLLSFHQVTYELSISESLPRSVRARIEYAPTPAILTGERTKEEAREIINCRLHHLCASKDVPYTESNGVEPIPAEVFESFSRRTTRALLQDADNYRRACIKAGKILTDWSLEEVSNSFSEEANHHSPTRLTEVWDDFLDSTDHKVPDSEEELCELLAKSIVSCGAELNRYDAFSVEIEPAAKVFQVNFPQSGEAEQPLMVTLCDGNLTGKNGLASQLRKAREMAMDQGLRLVVVRSSPFPRLAKAQANIEVKKILAQEGRRTIVQSSDWRKMVALEAFRREHQGPDFLQFLVQQQPLTNLECIRNILEWDSLIFIETPSPNPKETSVSSTPSYSHDSKKTLESAPRSSNWKKPDSREVGSIITQQEWKQGREDGSVRSVDIDEMEIGVRSSNKSRTAVLVDPQCFKRHAAFIGATGSGKTTLALQLLEQLMYRGVSGILVDRKGDLAGYRQPGVWSHSVEDARQDDFRARLQQKLDVVVYTPGHPEGCSLNLPLLPANVMDLSDFDRQQAVRASTDALTGMMNYGKSQKAQGKYAVLRRALQQLIEQPDRISAHELLAFVKEEDADFVADLGPLAKFIGDLALDLEILISNKKLLLDGGGELLSAAALLGKGPNYAADRNRLSIICTKFLGEAEEFFWISQLLMEVYRWGAKNPSASLQAVIFMDEADKYLPASRQPATKQPIENLLRRARSMGIGVFLATQNPGDFDYRARDNVLSWFVGHLTQATGIEKLRALFGESNGDVSGLAGQAPGQFHMLHEKRVHCIEAHRNAVLLPSQIAEEEILRLAADGLKAASELG
ncbi:MAG: DUF853 family protein [Myxococcales bacterium]|nr:DUF853 family protein [Myxococcales bacterium]